MRDAAVKAELGEGAVGRDGEDVEVGQQAPQCAPPERAPAELVGEARLGDGRAQERLRHRVHALQG